MAGISGRFAAAAVLTAMASPIWAGSQVAPAAATASTTTPESDWIVVDGDQVVHRDAVVPARPGLPLGRIAGDGFNTFDDTENIGTYTFRLQTHPLAETFRPLVQAAVNELNQINGPQYGVAPGTVPVTDVYDPNPASGEIIVMISTESPCGAFGWIGCGGPNTYTEVGPVYYYDSGAVWLLPDLIDSYGPDVAQQAVHHEIGHALGLDHFNGTYLGETQVMEAAASGVSSYRAGDRNGLRHQHPFPAHNDAFASPQALVDQGGVYVTTAVPRFGTAEAGEPAHAGAPALGSVWFSFVAPRSGQTAVTTAYADFDTRLAVYTGTSLGGLTLRASNDDASPGSGTSAASFVAVAGTTYRIAVDGKTGSLGGTIVEVHPPAPAGGFTPVTPSRILDTRQCLGVWCPPGVPSNRWPSGWYQELEVAGRGGVPVTGATAVVLNVTVADAISPGWITVYPAGESQPTASNLNYLRNHVVPNLVTVKLGTNGNVAIASSDGYPHLIADVVGWYGEGSGAALHPVAPVRIQESRPTGQVGLAGTWGPGQVRNLTVTGGSSGVPSDATAVVMNVTVTGTTASSWLTVWPAGQGQPQASNLNWTPGLTVPNLVTVGVGAGGQVSIANAAGSTHVIADVVGYYRSPGDLVTPVTPSRLLDTRDGNGLSGAFGPATTRTLPVAGRGPVPAGATGVILNVTVTGPTASSWLTLFPSGSALPTASNLNFVANQTVPNLVLVKLGAGGAVDIRNQAGTTHVIADVVAYVGG